MWWVQVLDCEVNHLHRWQQGIVETRAYKKRNVTFCLCKVVQRGGMKVGPSPSCKPPVSDEFIVGCLFPFVIKLFEKFWVPAKDKAWTESCCHGGLMQKFGGTKYPPRLRFDFWAWKNEVTTKRPLCVVPQKSPSPKCTLSVTPEPPLAWASSGPQGLNKNIL